MKKTVIKVASAVGSFAARMGASFALVVLGAVWAGALLSVPEPGVRMFDGSQVVTAVNQWNQQQTTVALTALAGGGQTGATQLNFGFNQVTVVATAADSVQLPPCVQGAAVYVTNDDGADAMTVYGKAGRTDTINGTAGATGVSQVAAAHALYFCVVPDAASGKWQTIRASS